MRFYGSNIVNYLHSFGPIQLSAQVFIVDGRSIVDEECIFIIQSYIYDYTYSLSYIQIYVQYYKCINI